MKRKHKIIVIWMIVVGFSLLTWLVINKNKKTTTTNATKAKNFQNSQEVNNKEQVPLLNQSQDDGSFYIEAETGKLYKAGEYSHVGASSRGAEAYLGDGGATVSYLINVPQGKEGEYDLKIKIFDDGKHPDGTRNATIYLNGNQYHYNHISKAINNWFWEDIGSVKLKAGTNEIIFMKDASTPGAFVMDAFKLVPFD